MSEAVKYAELGLFSIWYCNDGFFGIDSEGITYDADCFEIASDCITFMDAMES